MIALRGWVVVQACVCVCRQSVVWDRLGSVMEGEGRSEGGKKLWKRSV